MDETAIGMIVAERIRQVGEEGWTPRHDDGHTSGGLVVHAATLLVDGTDARVVDEFSRGTPEANDGDGDCWGLVKRHGYRSDSPDRIRALAIAGALVVAEIERLQRKAGTVVGNHYEDGNAFTDPERWSLRRAIRLCLSHRPDCDCKGCADVYELLAPQPESAEPVERLKEAVGRYAGSWANSPWPDDRMSPLYPLTIGDLRTLLNTLTHPPHSGPTLREAYEAGWSEGSGISEEWEQWDDPPGDSGETWAEHRTNVATRWLATQDTGGE